VQGRAAAAAHPEAGRLYWNLGQALDAAGNQQEAAISYRKASELAPCDIGMQMNLTTALTELNDVQGAARALASVVNMNPSPSLWPRATEAMKALKARGGSWAHIEPNVKWDLPLPHALIEELKKI
jgi:tetratricopeptide (TPR) repeat protein